MTLDYIVAIEKLIAHSGLLFLEIIHLEKDDFNLQQLTITPKTSAKYSRCRRATIIPSDVEWFTKWITPVAGKLFPFSERHIRYKWKEHMNVKPSILRKKFLTQWRTINVDANILATKFGYYVHVDEKENSELFKKLLEFEKNNPGVVS